MEYTHCVHPLFTQEYIDMDTGHPVVSLVEMLQSTELSQNTYYRGMYCREIQYAQI